MYQYLPVAKMVPVVATVVGAAALVVAGDITTGVLTGAVLTALGASLKLWRDMPVRDRELATLKEQLRDLEASIEKRDQHMSGELKSATAETRAALAELRTSTGAINLLAENATLLGKLATETLKGLADRQAMHERMLGENRGMLDMLVKNM